PRYTVDSYDLNHLEDILEYDMAFAGKPSQEGLEFKGWYSETNPTNIYEFFNMTYKAKWGPVGVDMEEDGTINAKLVNGTGGRRTPYVINIYNEAGFNTFSKWLNNKRLVKDFYRYGEPKVEGNTTTYTLHVFENIEDIDRIPVIYFEIKVDTSNTELIKLLDSIRKFEVEDIIFNEFEGSFDAPHEIRINTEEGLNQLLDGLDNNDKLVGYYRNADYKYEERYDVTYELIAETKAGETIHMFVILDNLETDMMNRIESIPTELQEKPVAPSFENDAVELTKGNGQKDNPYELSIKDIDTDKLDEFLTELKSSNPVVESVDTEGEYKIYKVKIDKKSKNVDSIYITLKVKNDKTELINALNDFAKETNQAIIKDFEVESGNNAGGSESNPAIIKINNVDGLKYVLDKIVTDNKMSVGISNKTEETDILTYKVDVIDGINSYHVNLKVDKTNTAVTSILDDMYNQNDSEDESEKDIVDMETEGANGSEVKPYEIRVNTVTGLNTLLNHIEGNYGKYYRTDKIEKINEWDVMYEIRAVLDDKITCFNIIVDDTKKDVINVLDDIKTERPSLPEQPPVEPELPEQPENKPEVEQPPTVSPGDEEDKEEEEPGNGDDAHKPEEKPEEPSVPEAPIVPNPPVEDEEEETPEDTLPPTEDDSNNDSEQPSNPIIPNPPFGDQENEDDNVTDKPETPEFNHDVIELGKGDGQKDNPFELSIKDVEIKEVKGFLTELKELNPKVESVTKEGNYTLYKIKIDKKSRNATDSVYITIKVDDSQTELLSAFNDFAVETNSTIVLPEQGTSDNTDTNVKPETEKTEVNSKPEFENKLDTNTGTEGVVDNNTNNNINSEGNISTNNSSSDNPKTEDVGIVGYATLGLASILGIFKNRRKRN
ncbi:MAG: hypothetical protein J6D41_03040, partial [Clostridium sp.]|nr:hypothetical protein [Clostridium sp.]